MREQNRNNFFKKFYFKGKQLEETVKIWLFKQKMLARMWGGKEHFYTVGRM
jgi:hypothetical protein